MRLFMKEAVGISIYICAVRPAESIADRGLASQRYAAVPPGSLRNRRKKKILTWRADHTPPTD